MGILNVFAISHKVRSYQPGVDNNKHISMIGSEPPKALFNINSFVNTSSSNIRSKLTKVRQFRALLSINLHNPHAIDSLRDYQKVEVPVSVRYPNVQSL